MIRRAIGHYNTLNENRSHGERAVYAEFGRRLQARMIQLGWNQSELSRRATAYLPRAAKGQVQGHSLGRDRISSYIRGKYLPRPDGLEAIAKALQCEPADLLPPAGVPSVVNNPDMLRSTKDPKDSTMQMRGSRKLFKKASTNGDACSRTYPAGPKPSAAWSSWGSN